MLHLNTKGLGLTQDLYYKYSHNCAPSNINHVVRLANTLGLDGVIVDAGEKILLEHTYGNGSSEFLLREALRIEGYQKIEDHYYRGLVYSQNTYPFNPEIVGWWRAFRALRAFWTQQQLYYQDPSICFYADERTSQPIAQYQCIWRVYNRLLIFRYRPSYSDYEVQGSVRYYEEHQYPHHPAYAMSLGNFNNQTGADLMNILHFFIHQRLVSHLYNYHTNRIEPAVVGARFQSSYLEWATVSSIDRTGGIHIRREREQYDTRLSWFGYPNHAQAQQ